MIRRPPRSTQSRSSAASDVYKRQVGEEPRWVDGLDLLGRLTGITAAVVPHYDNAEGATHDTRFCYLGERRLTRLEADLPAECGVLGLSLIHISEPTRLGM